MKKKHIALIIVGTVLFILYILGSVLGSFDFTRYRRVGKTNYYLVEDVFDVFNLHYKNSKDNIFGEGIISGRIIDAYWNDQYILVAQYAVSSDSIEGYYILKMLPPVNKGVPWKLFGPLSKEEYEKKKQKFLLNEKNMKHVDFE